MDMQQVHTNGTVKQQSRPWQRAGMATGVVAGLLFSIGALIPVAVNQTSYRNVLLNQTLKKHGLTAVASRSNGGWLDPFEFHDVVVSDSSGQLNGKIESLKSNRSILSHLFSGRKQSTVTLIHPRISIALDKNGLISLKTTPETATGDITFLIQNGEVTLQVPWRDLPILELDQLNVQGTVVQESDGRWLTVDAIDVLDHTELSDRHTEQNLALVAPLLSQATSLNGIISAQLSPIRICIDEAISTDQSLLHGTVQVHSMKARLRKEWSRNIVRLAGQVKQTAIPADVKMVSGSEIQFSVSPKGIHHAGFKLLLPDVARGLEIASSGVLQLDEQIELTLSIQMPMIPTSHNSFLSSLTDFLQAPIRLRVTGTVSDPTIVTPDGRTLLEEFTHRVAPAVHTEDSNSVEGSVRVMIQTGTTKDETTRKQQLPERIFGLIGANEAAKTQP